MDRPKNSKIKKHPEADKIAAKLREEAKKRRTEREGTAKTELRSAIQKRDARNEKARDVLSSAVVTAARVIVDCQAIPQSITEEEAKAYKCKLDAAKHCLKLNGLEVSRTEIGFDGDNPFQGVIILPPVLEAPQVGAG